MDDACSQIKLRLAKVISEDNYKTWIEPLKIKECVDGVCSVIVPNAFFRDWIIENFEPIFRSLLKEATGQDVRMDYLLEREDVKVEKKNVALKKQPASAIFKPRYTFENFVVGESNQFATAACLAVANNPGKVYNPLFIYGGVGLGKTHLLNAIGNSLTSRPGSGISRMSYITAEEFTNELINALRFEKMEDFRNKFRKMDVLLIDDIQFIAGKERTQAEFFHTFNTLYDNTKQIVVTSDKFPKDIPNFEERLRTRFEWGLIADIQPPDFETKVAILNKKAEMENVTLPQDVAFYLATNIEHNIRVLEGSLIRLGAFASLRNVPITIALAREVMGNILVDKKKEITIDIIIKEVASHFSVKPSDLKSAKRIKTIMFPRQVAIFLSRKLTTGSLVSIGEKFGGKDHATVIHSIKKVEEAMAARKDVSDTVEKIEARIKST